jgi:hypothetical protein
MPKYAVAIVRHRPHESEGSIICDIYPFVVQAANALEAEGKVWAIARNTFPNKKCLVQVNNIADGYIDKVENAKIYDKHDKEVNDPK